MKGKFSFNQWMFVSIALLLAAGCAATPVMPEGEGVVFAQPADVIAKAAVDALVVHGFDIEKKEPLYIEGFRPRKIGFFVGSGGETVGIWLQPLEPSRTRVQVKTALSLVGIVGQRDWDAEILARWRRFWQKSHSLQREFGSK
jgi:hypothetical protein